MAGVVTEHGGSSSGEAAQAKTKPLDFSKDYAKYAMVGFEQKRNHRAGLVSKFEIPDLYIDLLDDAAKPYYDYENMLLTQRDELISNDSEHSSIETPITRANYQLTSALSAYQTVLESLGADGSPVLKEFCERTIENLTAAIQKEREDSQARAESARATKPVGGSAGGHKKIKPEQVKDEEDSGQLEAVKFYTCNVKADITKALEIYRGTDSKYKDAVEGQILQDFPSLFDPLTFDQLKAADNAYDREDFAEARDNYKKLKDIFEEKDPTNLHLFFQSELEVTQQELKRLQNRESRKRRALEKKVQGPLSFNGSDSQKSAEAVSPVVVAAPGVSAPVIPAPAASAIEDAVLLMDFAVAPPVFATPFLDPALFIHGPLVGGPMGSSPLFPQATAPVATAMAFFSGPQIYNKGGSPAAPAGQRNKGKRLRAEDEDEDEDEDQFPVFS